MKKYANHLELDKSLLVTQNGDPNYLRHDAADYEQQQTLALLKLINLSEKSAASNGLLSLDEAFEV